MKDILINFVKDFGAIEWLCVWLVLFAPPVIASYIAISAYRKKEIRAGTVSLLIALALGGLLALLLWSVGAQMVRMTIESAGLFVIGILVAAAFCLAVYPISLVGFQLRAAFEYGKAGRWAEGGRRSLLIGIGGLLALASIAGVVYKIGGPIGAAVFGGLALIILLFGLGRQYLVPEI